MVQNEVKDSGNSATFDPEMSEEERKEYKQRRREHLKAKKGRANQRRQEHNKKLTSPLLPSQTRSLTLVGSTSTHFANYSSLEISGSQKQINFGGNLNVPSSIMSSICSSSIDKIQSYATMIALLPAASISLAANFFSTPDYFFWKAPSI